MIRLSPSILAADFANLQSEIQKVEREVDLIHVDVMDGHFVPNITIGVPVVQALRRITELPLDVHLMISRPDPFIPIFAEAGSSILTIHYEACVHLHRSIELTRSLGVSPWVSINPHTPVILLEEILPWVDGILVMGVNPGYTAQKFIPSTLRKVQEIRSLSKKIHPSLDISVDGGVGLDNARILVEHGATVLVAGAAIFHQPDPALASRTLRQHANGEWSR